MKDSDDLPSRDDVSHRAVFGDDIDEEELLEEIESEEKMETGNGSSSENDDSEGPDQVDSDEQDDVDLGNYLNKNGGDQIQGQHKVLTFWLK